VLKEDKMLMSEITLMVGLGFLIGMIVGMGAVG